jgi:hypothetical protein
MRDADSGPCLNAPAVSVVMPVRDGGVFLAAAMESILGQTLTALELVVVDDGSTDGTADLLAQYADRDRRVRVVRQSAVGLGAALRIGCDLAQGDLLARMDADDIAVPDRLARQVAFLSRHPAVAVVGSAVTYVDPSGATIKVGPATPDDATIRERLQREAVFFHPTVLMRRSAYRAVGGYRSVAVPCEDLDLWLRLAERYELANLTEPLLRYRLHPSQIMSRGTAATATAVLAVRAAARLRAAGEPDPLAAHERLDEDLLARLGISSVDIAHEQVAVLSYAATKMGQAGCLDAAAQHWRDALRLARRLPRRAELVPVVLRARAERGGTGGRLAGWRDLLLAWALSHRPAPRRDRPAPG